MSDPRNFSHDRRAGGTLQEDNFGSDGHILSDRERHEVRRKAGKCIVCGLVQTHERPKKGLFTRLNLRPVTLEGEIYKGIHLQCHGGMVNAKRKLGERITQADRDYDARRSAMGGTAAA
eukprot:CAMPEP_0113571088 /NCGR_PEP_ID=MMETSP0015_2-20120614/25355_1 /TAXON_ID=2838 /ORGANISM="Odontella" /LENGTH=118 /DNA_ID=CAMNT_0000473991 /DNA_START=166 /DNA_END=519 /DNA_ORIENTATION=+ /assembly_acc=CAM_ASM_000160